MISSITHGVHLTSISIQTYQTKLPATITLQQTKQKFGPWLTKSYIVQKSLCLHQTFLCLTILLLFLLDGVSVTDIFTNQHLWNRLNNMIRLYLTSEQLNGKDSESSDSVNKWWKPVAPSVSSIPSKFPSKVMNFNVYYYSMIMYSIYCFAVEHTTL